MPTSASAPRNAATLGSVFMPVSTSVQAFPPRTRYTLTIEGRIGSGRYTCTTPSAISRAFAASRLLLVQPLLDREREGDPTPPRAPRPVLDHRRDPGDVRLPDAVDRRRRAGHRETDGVLDRIRRGPGERDRLLYHRTSLHRRRAPRGRHYTLGRRDICKL